MSELGEDRVEVAVAGSGEGTAPRFEVLSAEEIADGTDRVAALFSGQLGGVVVRGLLSADEASAVVHGLRADPGDAGPVVAPPFPGFTYGAVLVVSPPDLVAYRQRSRALHAALERVGVDLDGRFAATLAALGGGTSVTVPAHADGAPYAGLTVRVLEAGQGVAVHSERADWPSMADLGPRLASRAQLSCYAPLALGRGGGELRIYHRPPSGREPAMEGRDPAAAEAALAAFGCTIVRPGVGDLLLFDGGRFNHRVTPAEQGERWTVGCFLGRTPDGTRWRWS